MKHKKRRPKGMLPKKRRMYQNGGGVGDPPRGTIPTEDVLARLSLGITPPQQEFRLTGGDAPFRTIREEQDRMTAETVDDSMFEVARFLPVIGEGIDAAELAKVAATGEDFYGEEQDPAMFAGMTAAGYLIPNILEKPLKSAWRAIKKFPSKMPKKEFRELMGPEKDEVRANLTQGHLEVYGDKGYTESLSGARPVNVRQLPSLMSGSKLENAVGKDGMIQVSQIENLINSKDISTVEKEALQEALFRTRSRSGYASGLEPGSPLPDKIDYLSFKRAGSDVVSTRRGDATFFVDETYDQANYGLNRLGYKFDIIPRLQGGGSPRTNLIRTTDPDLQSTEYGHFGRDVIGHYRTFERPDEKGVLYISELQADPLQARGRAGEKRVGLDIREEGPTAKQANLIKNQDQFLISHILEQEAKGADKLRFPTGETTAKIQGYGDSTRRISRAKADVELYESISKEARENELVDKTFKEHPMFKGKSEDAIIFLMEAFAKTKRNMPSEDILDMSIDDDRVRQAIKNLPSTSDSRILAEYEQGFRDLGGDENATRKAVFDWYDATKKLRSSREHLSRINASQQATQGIMKGYDRLPKALKKHGLDATKVTDDVGNTWWEVDIPARLGEGVGEIRAYKKGGKFRILKK